MNKSKKKPSIIFHIFSVNLPHPCFGVSLAVNILSNKFTEQQVYGFYKTAGYQQGIRTHTNLIKDLK